MLLLIPLLLPSARGAENGVRIEEVLPLRALVRGAPGPAQPVIVRLQNSGGATEATLSLDGGGPSLSLPVPPGASTATLTLPAVATESRRQLRLHVTRPGERDELREVVLSPVRHLTVYILPHSHTDIGYTEIQTAIEKKQVNNLLEGMAAARRTAGYPEGARFVWNVEVLWAADLYLHRLDEAQRAEFFQAVKSGQVVLNGMYLNELTGLCRPEELMQLFRLATEVSRQTGVPVTSAMISDVPGCTWGTVTAMAQAGIRYFSTAPNYFDRIGTTLREWENKPFWWEGPDGRSRVLVWIPFWGYAMSHKYREMSPRLVQDFSEGLEKRGYPYDISYLRWSGHGDNAVPDPSICEFVRGWNAAYAWPRFIISGAPEAFAAMERRHGAKLPVVRGDWTPYWEDGAGSSALETGMNRETADRLTQAEGVMAMSRAARFPSAAFGEAWRDVLLYSEHTWGADVSVSDPESQKTREQWEIKQGYARKADAESRVLLGQALEALGGMGEPRPASVDVVNPLGWARSGSVTLGPRESAGRDRVVDARGHAVPSQRLASGELVFEAGEVPPLGVRRFTLEPGAPGVSGRAMAEGASLDNGRVRVRIDPVTGAIAELTVAGVEGNLVDRSGGEGLNDYRFLPGNDLRQLARNGPVRIETGERGPLVASLRISSAAPGARGLEREVRLWATSDRVEIENRVDKSRAAIPAKGGDWKFAQTGGKESVNFAFPLQVPGGELLLDIPHGWMRPEADQIAGACKNWFTLGRWADLSSARNGVLWVTIDAPLVELGGITATLLGSQTNPDIWRSRVEPTGTLYSWAMNNHWGTNYRAYQEGPVRFRYVLIPHGARDIAANIRAATAASQPLLARPARGPAPGAEGLVSVSPASVVLVTVKPTEDGRGVLLRLFGASPRQERARLHWGGRPPRTLHLTDLSERPGEGISRSVAVPSRGLVSVRADFD